MSTRTSEPKTLTCPPAETLRQLVSGSLNEDHADLLFLHLDECKFCQEHMDTLAGDAPVLLGDKPVILGEGQIPEGETCEAKLSQLIRQARQLGTPTTEPPAEVREPVGIEGFVAGMKRCGLFTGEEVDALLAGVEAEDSVELAQELQQQGHLTRFQAKVLLSGRKRRLVLGNYDILKKLGQGGMGSVYKARHRRLGRIVCVKVMNSAGRRSPGMLERFQNEARTVAALSHPNFVVAHDADEADGIPFLVMEYIEGNDLARHVSIAGPLPVDFGLKIVHQAAVALQYAHDQGVTHRDIKPHNIVVTREDETSDLHVTILDLGLARIDTLLEEAPDSSSPAAMTRTGVIMGTVDYMSPEQAIRSRDADNRSDIYSLGCTLHFLLTGSPVYTGDTMMARLVEHRESPIPTLEDRVPGTPAGLDAIFHRMLAKKPEERYQSMQDLVTDLDALLMGQQLVFAEPVAEATSVLEERRRTRRPQYGLWIGVCSSILMFASAVIFAMTTGLGKGDSDSRTDVAGTRIPIGEGATGVRGRSLDRISQGTGNSTHGFPLTKDGAVELTRQILGARTDYNRRKKTAAVILPTTVNEKHLQALQAEAESQGVTLTLAAPGGATVTGMHDSAFSVAPEKSLTALTFTDYDMLFVVDGDLKSLNRDMVDKQCLKSLYETSYGQRCVVAATSRDAYKLLIGTRDEKVRRDLPDGVTNSITNDDQRILYTDDSQSVGALLKDAIHQRRSSVLPYVDRATREAFGPGRALILIPFETPPAQLALFLNILREHHVSVTIMSDKFDKRALPSGQEVMIGDLLRMEILRDVPFTYRFDYVFVFPDRKMALKKRASGNLTDVIYNCVRDGAVLAGISSDSMPVLKLYPQLESIRFGLMDHGIRYAEKYDRHIIYSETTSEDALNALYQKAFHRRGAALSNARQQ